MIPVLFHVGPYIILGHQFSISLYSYGLMMALGFIVADRLLVRECARRGLKPEFGTALVVWGAVAGIVGSRALDIVNNWSGYMANPSAMIFSGSGFVWYGGLIVGIIATWLVSRHYRVSFLSTCDMAAPALVLGQAFGRMGCLLSGDGDWGLPSKLPWAMAYPNAIVGWNANSVLKLDSHWQLVSGFYPGVRVHPTPIYEVILYVGIFMLLWSMRAKAAEGRLLYLYLILAGLARFMVEFLRINPRVLFGLSEAQLISIVMMVAGAAGIYLSSLKHSTLDAGHPKEAARA